MYIGIVKVEYELIGQVILCENFNMILMNSKFQIKLLYFCVVANLYVSSESQSIFSMYQVGMETTGKFCRKARNIDLK